MLYVDDAVGARTMRAFDNGGWLLRIWREDMFRTYVREFENVWDAMRASDEVSASELARVVPLRTSIEKKG